nr:uncharacterized protein LOC120972617 [Aegilops tauschii subsp. strangulata]
MDTWLTPKPLATTFSHLFSHSTLQLVKVANILSFGIEANLCNRLSLTAEQELASLLAILQDFTPSTEEDQRFLLQGHDFSTKQAYGTLMTKPDMDLIAPLIWGTKAPRKIKIFVWLLFKDRLNTIVNLAHKHIISSNLCPRYAASPEDTTHLFIACPLANRIWQRVGFLPSTDDLNELWDIPLPQHLPKNAWPFVLLALLWKIWTARNDMLFRCIDQCFVMTIRNLISDLDLWSHRLIDTGDKEDVLSWRSYLSARCTVPL